MTAIKKTLLTLALVGEAAAFSPNSIKPLHCATRLNSFAIDSDDDAMSMMMKADLCARSETCSIDDAEHYLEEVLHLQSDCVSGAISSEQICDDIAFPSQVVASLREKIELERRYVAEVFERILNTNLIRIVSLVTSSRLILNRKSTFKLNPVVVSLGAAYLAAGAWSMVHHPGVEPFTAQEWAWGIRDGYAGEMIQTFMKHGGMPAVDQVDVTPFTPQEWWWSVRDGYFSEMFSQSAKNGGLVVYDAPVEDIVTAQFLPEEWSNAIKDGYASDMISHYFKNGGL
jgi:hypothetical protein